MVLLELFDQPTGRHDLLLQRAALMDGAMLIVTADVYYHVAIILLYLLYLNTSNVLLITCTMM